MLLPELAAYLEGQGIGTRGTDLFYGITPATPDVLVAVLHYGGIADEPDLGTGKVRFEFPRIQVLCRGIRYDYDGPMLTANNVKVALTKVQNQALSGVRYLIVQCENGPFYMRSDENSRRVFVANYQVIKELSTS